MFFPYGTDAPIYHLPIATVGVIVVNTFLFFSVPQPSATNDTFRTLALEFDRIAPWQWLTCNFMHLGFMHLAGNMVFLWTFGLIVEGKIGWWRFLLTYVVIGTVFGAVIQLGMFVLAPRDASAAGASAVIFGLIGIAAMWAPKNDVTCFVGYIGTLEIPVLMFCFLYFAWQWLGLAFTGFAMSSELLHVVGLAVGIPIGLLFVTRSWVDCEGWDVIAVLAGREGRQPDRSGDARRGEKARPIAPTKTADQRRLIFESLKQALGSGNAAAAAALYVRHQSLLRGWQEWDSATQTALIAALHREKRWLESIPLMRELVDRDPERTRTIRLKLADILVREAGRPKLALRLLAVLPADLSEQQARMRSDVVVRAKRAIQDGGVELPSDD